MIPSTETTNDLVARVNRKETGAVEQLAARAVTRLRHLAQAMLRGKFPAVAKQNQTDDVLDEAWTKMVKSYRDLLERMCREIPPPVTISAFSALVRCCCFQCLIDLARAQGRRRDLAAGENGAVDELSGMAGKELPPDQPSEVQEQIAKLTAAIDQLPELDRQVLDLVYFTDPPLSYEDAGEILKISAKKVSKTWLRLRELLGCHFPEETD